MATVAQFTDPQSAELIGLMGIDCLWIDLEHQPIGMSELANMVRAARVGDMDMLFFGPGDYSIMADVPGEFDSDILLKGMAETAAAALAAGKRFGTLVTNIDQAKRALDLGASLLTYGSDLHFVRAALLDMRKQFATLGFPFGKIVGGKDAD
ncbi:MAG: hypothetical protein JXM70_28870 [Pirellulales bacterium]|nr:hypothetical protein [Pirellulales bacterium]